MGIISSPIVVGEKGYSKKSSTKRTKLLLETHSAEFENVLDIEDSQLKEMVLNELRRVAIPERIFADTVKKCKKSLRDEAERREKELLALVKEELTKGHPVVKKYFEKLQG